MNRQTDTPLSDDVLARVGEAAENACLSEMSWPEIGHAALEAARYGEPARQPIETAPRDDTMFLAGCPDGRIMIWSGRIFALQDEITPDHLRFPATHWMPLPASPNPSPDTIGASQT
jgi:hypothetical protein